MDILTPVLIVSAIVGAIVAVLGSAAASFGVDTRPGFDGRPTDR